MPMTRSHTDATLTSCLHLQDSADKSDLDKSYCITYTEKHILIIVQTTFITLVYTFFFSFYRICIYSSLLPI